MLTAGQTIDIFHRIVKRLDSFTTYECDTAGILRIYAFDREVVRYFSGNGEVLDTNGLTLMRHKD
jgi:hypothetical protein